MSTEIQAKVQASSAQNFTPAQTGLLQRKSALCNTPGLVEDSGRDKEKLTLQRSSADQAGTTTMPPIVPRFGHDFSRVSVHSTGSGMIQAKLKINEPGDLYEQEADRVADAMMRIPENAAISGQVPAIRTNSASFMQRQTIDETLDEEDPEELNPFLESVPTRDAGELGEEEESTPILESVPARDAGELGEEEELNPILESVPTGETDEFGEEEEEELIQPKSNTSAVPQVTPGVAHNIHSFKGTGQPLPASERTFFEPRFGRDFSNVRVHTDNRAARTAQAINARAFTLGRDVVFGSGQFAPGAHFSRKLLAHELAHVVQQQAHVARSPVPTNKYVSRDVAQKAIEAYLRRALKAQKGKYLQVTPVVKWGLRSLFFDDNRLSVTIRLNALLTRAHLLEDPAVLARLVAKLLPLRVNRKKADNLAHMPVTRKKTKFQRIKEYLSPKPRQASPLERALPDQGSSSSERFEGMIKHWRKAQGLPTATTYGPYKVDVLALLRKLRKDTNKPAKQSKPAKMFPMVEKSLGQIGAHALVPGNILIRIKRARHNADIAGPDEEPLRYRQLKDAEDMAGNYASSHLVARSLARKMVAASRQGTKNIPLRLGDNYNKVRQRKAIYSELDRIAQIVYNRLGTLAPMKVVVEVYFGTKLVRFISLKRPK